MIAPGTDDQRKLRSVPFGIEQVMQSGSPILCLFEKKIGNRFRVHLFEPVNETGR